MSVTDNPLVSHKPSEVALSVSLHPLVLLTASDLITRHSVREEEGPLAGILLGQQNGQGTTAEHAFPASVTRLDTGEWILDLAWLETRIQQFKDVHKAPALDVVGWFTTCPETGPLVEHIGIQLQLNAINDNCIFLAIHPSALDSSETTNRKLPLTVYESVVENEVTQDGNNMQVDGEEATLLKFRQLSYSIETDETEMIAIDYVAKGAGSAAAVTRTMDSNTTDKPAEAKGKQRADGKNDRKDADTGLKLDELTLEEEDQIAGITTRLNSVKMLQTRLQSITRFVQSLPPSYITDPNVPFTPSSPDPQHLPHLRNVQSLLARLALLTPTQGADKATGLVQEAAQYQRNDVALTTLLAQLGQDVQALNELGRKFATVEVARSSKSKNKGGGNQGSFGGLEESDGRIAGFTVSEGMLV